MPKILTLILSLALLASTCSQTLSSKTNSEDLAKTLIQTNAMPTKLKAQLRYTTSDANKFSEIPEQTIDIKKDGVINLKDEQNKDRAIERYSFQVVDIKTDSIIIKQVPDELGAKNINGWRNTSAVADQWELKVGEPIKIGWNVPGGGPEWTLTLPQE